MLRRSISAFGAATPRRRVRLILAIAGVAVFMGLASASPSQGAGRVGHLVAHGKVVWVLERSDTGEILSVTPGRMAVLALDTDTSTPWCSIPSCAPSGDSVVAFFRGFAETTAFEGNFDQDGDSALLALPEGVDLLFVDGGEPGTAPVGPPNAAGIAPTADYVQWLNISPAFILKAYLQTGNIQIKG